jgi:hypothetical protein
VWWVFAVGAALLFGIFALVGLFAGEHLGFWLGAGFGSALTLLVVLIDSPPHRIERWREGAEGERNTARGSVL